MMKKSLIIATAMFAAVVGLQPTQQAEAKVHFDIHLGGPGYYGGGHGGHWGGHGGRWGNGGHWAPRRISCSRGRRIVRNHGYHGISAIDCRGSVYKFKAWRGGNRYLLKMKSRNGRIYRRFHI